LKPSDSASTPNVTAPPGVGAPEALTVMSVVVAPEESPPPELPHAATTRLNATTAAAAETMPRNVEFLLISTTPNAQSNAAEHFVSGFLRLRKGPVPKHRALSTLRSVLESLFDPGLGEADLATLERQCCLSIGKSLVRDVANILGRTDGPL